MISFENTKGRDYLKICIFSKTQDVVQIYNCSKISSQNDINQFTKTESEMLRKKLKHFKNTERIKIVNHVVGSIKDYYNFLLEN